MNIYIKLTEEFNRGRLRAIISSGQAVVLHRLAITSKDGDWIIREDEESTNHILKTLSNFGAKYRFGAPLDCRWLKNGWSSHFEFMHDKLRIRTDFVSRPPRISEEELRVLWTKMENRVPPFVDLCELAELKKTNREKDYPIIGELARKMEKVEEKFLYSRSARDLLELAEKYPDSLHKIINKRSLLTKLKGGVSVVEAALDAERRDLMHKNEQRLLSYINASLQWKNYWPEIEQISSENDLVKKHKIIVVAAEKYLTLEQIQQ